jgi:cytosine/adenosine deaminase-related metal-dependent hydrolase
LNNTSLVARMHSLEQRITAIEAELIASPSSNLRQIRSSRPAPGALLKQLADGFGREGKTSAEDDAAFAIRLCADWLDAQGVGAGVAAARWLREEAARACAVNC